MANDRLEQLLDMWMFDRDNGITRTATEICADSPELAEELSRRILVVQRFEQLADIGQSETFVSQGEVDTSQIVNVPVPASARITSLPTSIGPFRPLAVLGEGGMGAVYLAEDPQLGRRVAVKVMKKELAADQDAKHRFLREARAMATVEHDNIMTIYAVGEDQGMPYLVMPVLKGETLDDRLRRETRLSVAETRRIGQEIAAGLAAAHSHGLIHRDIKPSNIWLEGTQGRVRILDFGLARPASEDQKVTQSGAVLGTPAYMAPEQAAGTEATPRSDLFSLGAVLYRMATGVQPFAGPNMMATLNNLANKHPDPPHRICPEVPESLSELILRLIAKPAEERPDSAAAVVDSLQQSAETLVPQFTVTPSPVAVVTKSAVQLAAPEAAKGAASGTQPPQTFRKALAGGFVGFMVLMSFIVYRIQTDKGVLIVSIDDEQVAAKLTKGGLDVVDAKTGRTWTIKPDQPESVPSGEYKVSQPNGLLLHVTDDSGTEFTTAEFKIKRRDQITVRVTLEKPKASVVVNSDWKGWPKDAPAPAIAPFDAAQAKRHQEEWAKHLGVPVEFTNSIGMKFVLIPPGEFLMGSTSEEVAGEVAYVNKSDARWMECLQTESPRHRVVLSEAIYVAAHEVTTQQFLTLSSETNSKPNLGKDDHPVVWVTHTAVEDFCRLLNKHESMSGDQADGTSVPVSMVAERGYRLLTEAEWEFACRAGTSTRFWSGADEASIGEAAWFAENSAGSTHPVGTRKSNAFGLHDMLGNAWEWCADEWSPAYYAELAAGTAVNPAGPQLNKSVYVARGGDWHDVAAACRVAFRFGYPVTFRSSGMGFRVALPWRTVKELRLREDSNMQTEAGSPSQVPLGQSPLDVLSADQIPLEERLDSLPKEVVAVVGTHEQKTWGGPLMHGYASYGNLTYSPDGKWICAGDWSNAYLFDATTLDLKSTIPYVHLNSGSSRTAVFSSDSKYLYMSGIASHEFLGTGVADLTTPKPSITLVPPSDGSLSGTAIAIAEKDELVSYAGSEGITVGTRDPLTGTVSQLTTLQNHDQNLDPSKHGGVNELAFSPDAKWLIGGYSRGGYQIFGRGNSRNREFQPVNFIQTEVRQNELRVAFSFTASHKRALLVEFEHCRLLDLSLFDELSDELPVPTHIKLELDLPQELTRITDISTSADGQTWAAAQALSDASSRLLIGNWVDGRPTVLTKIDVPECRVGRVALSPDADSVAAMANGRLLLVFDLTQNPPVKRSAHEETRMASNADVSGTVTVGIDGRIRLEAIGPDGPELLDSWNTDRGWVDVRVSDDGKRAVSITSGDYNISKRSHIYVWNLEQGKLDEFASFESSAGQENASSVLFAQGTRFLYGNQIWDISTSSPEIIATYTELPPKPAAAAVTSDGQRIALATWDGQLFVHNVGGRADKSLTTAKHSGAPGALVSLAFNHEGTRLVASFDGGICTVWDLVDGQLVESMRMPGAGQWDIEPNGPPYHMTSAVFSRGGHRVYFSGWGGVGEWNLDDNKVTRFWPLPGFATLNMANDDRHLILNNSNCTTYILRLTPP